MGRGKGGRGAGGASTAGLGLRLGKYSEKEVFITAQ